MAIGGEDKNVELTLDQQAALEALEAFGASVYEIHERATERRGIGLGGAMLTASMAVAAAGLPDCPYAPPGHPVAENKWSSSSPPRLILRCSHSEADGGPHCWDKTGAPTGC